LSRPAYNAIEQGKADPRSETLHRIADAMGVSIKDLFLDLPQLHSVRFRMNKATERKKKIREQEIIKIAQWLNNYNYLEEIIKNRKEYKLAHLKTSDPIKLAEKVREKLGIEKHEPINDISEVINNAGIKLHLANIPIDDFFGLSIGAQDGGPAISVNVAKGISIERQIFTAAHEMAHLMLHKDSYKGDLFEDDEKEEKEANVFASHFLMPGDEFIKVMERNKGLFWVDAILNVKRYFKVSYKTVLMRLMDIHMADASIFRKFAIEYKIKYGGNLKDHFEPAALQELESLARGDLMEDRLYTLVRDAIEKELISLSKGADILNISNDEMRGLANSWEEINWKGLSI
jgi:Zn-dependent peptidase ImmA (M78 family)/DNA-binding XRE family transcriptional regulator